MSIGLFLAGTAHQFKTIRLERGILIGAGSAVALGLVACAFLPINVGI